jgi:RNase adapter protein RapZ
MDDESSGNLIIVSGMSGAGRSSVADVLEDLGWFVVDNLPPMFLTAIVDQVVGTGASPRLAIVVDVRTGMFFDELGAALQDLRTKGYRPVTLFLEASDDVIVRRQESVRRPHPLQGEGRLLDGIRRERDRLGDIRASADLVIDTSNLNIHQLAARIVNAFGDEENAELRATVVSFGFKYGIPVDADVVADMRFLPNPHWQPDLRPMTGQDQPVSDFVLAHPLTQQFLQNYEDVLDTLRTGYLNEGKRFVTVAIGCTGGKHRSVAMAEEIARRLRAKGSPTLVVHRDLGRE